MFTYFTTFFYFYKKNVFFLIFVETHQFDETLFFVLSKKTAFTSIFLISKHFVAFWGIQRLERCFEMMNCHCSFCFTIVWYIWNVDDTTTITTALVSQSIWNGFCNNNNSSCDAINLRCLCNKNSKSSCITMNLKCWQCNNNYNSSWVISNFKQKIVE